MPVEIRINVLASGLPAVAFAGKYAREVKAADMKNHQAAIYWVL